jgi:hypothetical protein
MCCSLLVCVSTYVSVYLGQCWACVFVRVCLSVSVHLCLCLSVRVSVPLSPSVSIYQRGVSVLVQGGALNRGLLFADPPPSPLGAVSGKISEIR